MAGTKTYGVSGSFPIGVTVTNTVGDRFTLSSGGSWADAAALPEPRYDFSAATGADGRICVLGGNDQNVALVSAVDANGLNNAGLHLQRLADGSDHSGYFAKAQE